MKVLATGLALAAAAAMISLSSGIARADQAVSVSGAAVVDNVTKARFDLNLTAVVDSSSGHFPNDGNIDLMLSSDRISICSVNGGRPGPGNEVLTVQCGAAHNMSVELAGCTAKASSHGFIHADNPFPPALGPASFTLSLSKTGPNSGVFKLDGRSGAGRFSISGDVTGSIAMSGCP